MTAATTRINLTTRLDHTDFQVQAADDLHDLLDQMSTLFTTRINGDRRKITTTVNNLGLDINAAEQVADHYHRSLRLLADAMATAARAAKTVGDSHAQALGVVNRHLRNNGRSPITGFTLALSDDGR